MLGDPGPHLHLLFLLPRLGLEGPQDLEAKEVTPRTALLTWIEPQVPPTGYLLTYDTLGGQTQVPPWLPRWPAALPGFHPRGKCLCLSHWGSSSLPLTSPFPVPQILLPGGVTSHQLLGLFPSTTYTAWLQAVWGESLASPVSTSFTTGT